MKLVNQVSLSRGAVLLDYAFSNKGEGMSLEVADLIGIVAAYIARGHPTHEIKERLAGVLSPGIAANVASTFNLFNNPRGLWSQGPAIDDISFTNHRLRSFYPHVGNAPSGLPHGSRRVEEPDVSF
jgi:hypothetical protein